MTVYIVLLIALVILFLIVLHRKSSSVQKLTPVLDVKSARDVRKNFGIDLPNGDGSDPTGSQVDYSFLLADSLKSTLKRGVPVWSSKFRSDVNKYIYNDKSGFVLKPAEFSEVDGTRLVNSYRLTSKKLFHGGLFIADIEHIPTGAGIWPAFWLNGFIGAPNQIHSDVYSQDLHDKALKCSKPVEGLNFKYGPSYLAAWPAQGEIDIVEQIGNSTQNTTSIHAGYDCFATDEAGLRPRTACGFNGDIRGCGDDYPSETRDIYDSISHCKPYGETQINGPVGSFGPPFNEQGGGVYALDWQPRERLVIWFFPREAIPLGENGPLGRNPSPEQWDSAYVHSYYKLQGCDFGYQELIINLAFGGGWGGSDPAWENGAYIAQCSSVAECFPEAFWKFKSIRVFQDASRGHASVW